jgi:hypothetical protein
VSVSLKFAEARTVWIADTHRGEKRFVIYAAEKLTAFLELESTIRCSALLGSV